MSITMSTPIRETSCWICDTCNTQILQASQAWVDWVDPRAYPPAPRCGYGVQIVHSPKHSPSCEGCRYPSPVSIGRGLDSVGSRPLTDFLGSDGRTRFLRTLKEQRMEREEEEELFRRVRIPGYEEARLHLSDAIEAGVLGSEVDTKFLKQSEIAAVLAWLTDPDSTCEGQESAVQSSL